MARCCLIALLLLLPVPSFSENLIEIDLDGVLGNGPDTLTVSQGTPVTITIWFDGDGDLWLIAFAVAPCGLNSENVALAEHLVTQWFVNNPLIADGCIFFEAATIDLMGISLPSAVAVITYVSNLDPGLYPIEIDPLQSYWYDNYSLSEVTIDSFIPGYLLVTEATSTSEDSWGDVKRLFR